MAFEVSFFSSYRPVHFVGTQRKPILKLPFCECFNSLHFVSLFIVYEMKFVERENAIMVKSLSLFFDH